MNSVELDGQRMTVGLQFFHAAFEGGDRHTSSLSVDPSASQCVIDLSANAHQIGERRTLWGDVFNWV